MSWRTEQEVPGERASAPAGLSVSQFTRSPKGVASSSSLQVNFTARSVFRKCSRSPGEMKKCSGLSEPLFSGAASSGEGSTFQGEIQVSVAHACCLEYKCE